MKRYINCYTDGYVTVPYRTTEEARQRALGTPYAIAVEIELPDPPHEWKVGDWADIDRLTVRVGQITDRSIAYTWLDEHGHARGSWRLRHSWDGFATPCCPPTWFTDGGAS